MVIDDEFYLHSFPVSLESVRFGLIISKQMGDYRDLTPEDLVVKAWLQRTHDCDEWQSRERFRRAKQLAQRWGCDGI